ncbi:MAG TPA: AI-2E family transporter [Acetobacteraceae bacterium]|nr:AI-2E family transporter [Acetobacteraceae bacterium]
MSQAVPAGADPELVPPPAEPDASRSMTFFVMVVATLYFGREVLVPVTLALLLSFLLAPLVGLLRRLHLGRVPSVLLAVIFAIGVMVVLGGVIGSQIGQLARNLPQYSTTIEKKVNSVRQYTVHELRRISNVMGRQGTKSGAAPAPAAPAGGTPAGSPQTNGLPGALQNPFIGGSQTHPAATTTPKQVEVVQASSSPLSMIRKYLTPILSPLATFGIVFVVAIFALLQKEDLRDRMIRLVGSSDLHRTTVAIDDGARRLSRYFLTQLCVNSSFGCVIGLGLFFIGVPNPVLFGIFTALLRFVPYVGSLLSALLPMALAAAVSPGWAMVIETAALYLVLEGVTGNFIEPMVYGHSTGLSPFSVIVAAIFWSWLWGPIGLILSTPLTLCLVVLGRHVKRLEFLDVLLGDRPALTPVESFYQRILAGDADEAQDHAELLLKDRPLSTYYDEVALKGLQLAANDAERGVLKRDQLTLIRNTVNFLIEGLDRYNDTPPANAKPDSSHEANAPRDGRALPHNPVPDAAKPETLPPAWQTEAPVLCVAGRGPLDEAASAMLVQLLEKHGIGARITSYQSVSRESIGSLDIEEVRMVCVSYLDISGSPAHLRYLMQRLRRRLPAGIPILVGLWPAEDAALRDERVRAVVGADYFTSSLREAVDACLKAARETPQKAVIAA